MIESDEAINAYRNSGIVWYNSMEDRHTGGWREKK